jgi:hypothetical protein
MKSLWWAVLICGVGESYSEGGGKSLGFSKCIVKKSVLERIIVPINNAKASTV